MQIHKLNAMTGGWFVGDFEPSVVRTPHAEVGVKMYKGGDKEPAHVHRVASEITLVVKGSIKINGQWIFAGEMCLLEPGEAGEFECITDCTLVVVKTPSVKGDKYPV